MPVCRPVDRSDPACLRHPLLTSTDNGGVLSIDLAGLESVRLTMVRHPFTTVTMQLFDAIGFIPTGMNGEWRREILGQIPRNSVRVLEPWRRFTPATFAEPVGPRQYTIEECLAILHDDTGDLIPPLLEAVVGADLPPLLADLGQRPAIHLRRSWEVLDKAAALTKRLWPEASSLLAREERCISMATSAEARTALLLSRVRGSKVQGCRLYLPWAPAAPQPRDLPIFGLADRIEMVPSLTGPRTAGIMFDDDGGLRVHRITYLLPGFDGRIDDDGRVRPDLLAELVGDVRADLLRALTKPMAMSNLAVVLALAPSLVTFHRDHLEAAGLVTRERIARMVFLSRTHRGHSLVELMGG